MIKLKNIKALSDKSQINICLSDTGAYINDGTVGPLKIGYSPLTVLKIKRLSDNREFSISSESGFKKTKVISYKEYTQIALINPLDGEVSDFMLLISIKPNKTNIEWEVSVLNDNHGYSVMSVSYPVLKVIGDVNAFLPKYGGVVEENVIENGFCDSEVYPRGGAYSMQYFAFYNDNGGIYAATHDETGSVKNIFVNTYKEKNICELIIDFPAINMGRGANSFKLPGKMVWQNLCGDWYDASNIYREFVLNNAEWIPEIDENGRTDTPEWFKNIPFWIMDWVPNIEGKDDELPTNLKPLDGSEIKEDDWIENAIKLQKELGVPIGYHIYNWHKIPFNNDYPHYFPEQRGVKEGIQRLKENNIYTMPYINARLWDTLDRENTDYMYEGVAKKWAVKLENGKVYTSSFESYEKDGQKCSLAVMCPSSGVWKTQISGVVSKIFNYLGTDAVYLDQIAAAAPKTCCDKEHNHLPGGGNWWIKSYNEMLMRYKTEKNENCAITSESNAETYLKGLDGYLTWLWVQSNSVPAFSRVYAGYAVFFGRNSDGKKKGDIMFYKHNIAQALLYGQQLGWINADIVKNEKKMTFLKKMVSLRYRYTRFFNCGELLRPPKTECDIENIETEPPMWFSGPQIIRHALSGIWRLKDKSQTLLFAINIADKSAKITLTCDKYGENAVLKEGDAKIISVKNIDGKMVIDILAEPESYAVLDIV